MLNDETYYRYVSIDYAEDSIILNTKYIIAPNIIQRLKGAKEREFDVVFVRLHDVWIEEKLLLVCSKELSNLLDKIAISAIINPLGNFIGLL